MNGEHHREAGGVKPGTGLAEPERIVWGADHERRQRRLRARQRIVSSPGPGLRPNAAVVLSGTPQVCPRALFALRPRRGASSLGRTSPIRKQSQRADHGELGTVVGKSLGSGAAGTSRWWGVH
jgi:hypothetical protein